MDNHRKTRKEPIVVTKKTNAATNATKKKEKNRCPGEYYSEFSENLPYLPRQFFSGSNMFSPAEVHEVRKSK